MAFLFPHRLSYTALDGLDPIGLVRSGAAPLQVRRVTLVLGGALGPPKKCILVVLSKEAQDATPANSRPRRILAARSPARHLEKRKSHHEKNPRSRPRRQSGLPSRSIREDRYGTGAPHRRRRNTFPRNHHQRRIPRYGRRLARDRQDARRSRRLVFRKLRAQF